MGMMERLNQSVSRAENPRPTFEQVMQMGKEDALARIRDRFENAKNPLDNLEYHVTSHTEAIIRRTRKILEAVREASPQALNERSLLVGEYVAANHDTVQNYEVVQKDGGIKIRKRFVEKNEFMSLEESLAFIHKIDPNLLTPEEEDILRDAIPSTIPDYSPEHGTVIQPRLTETSGLIARAVALADLGTAGMDGPEAYLPEGNAIFREDNMDIPESLHNPEKRDFLTKRMLAWSEIQISFATGRKALLDTELQGLSPEVQNAVRALFNKFDESIAAAEAQLERRRAMNFEELARDFGYTPPKYTLH